MTDDHIYKELFSVFFLEFVDLFLPGVAGYLDKDFALVPMDKELFPDIRRNDSYEVDLLMKARFRGKKTFFLIHVENESTKRAGFPKRLYRYYTRIEEKYDLPVYPVAVFSYQSPRIEAPHSYEIAFPDKTVLKFDYTVIQLNRLSWRDYIDHPNPVASALMARMNVAHGDRPKVKMVCLRMLMGLKLGPAKTSMIGAIIDNYLKLNAEEMKQFEREMDTLGPEKKEETMEWMTSWERKGLEQGLHQGKEEILALLLEQRFSTLPDGITERLDRLTSEQFNELAKALFGFASLEDLDAWLTETSGSEPV
jgi:hypothetical protein